MVTNPFSRDPAVTVGVNADTSGFDNAIGNAIGQLGGFRKAVGVTGAAVGALGVAVGAKAVESYSSFDAKMNESLAIMGDVSDSMEGEMSEAARNVATTTSFSAEEAAESYFFLASAGLDAKESMESLDDVAQFAQAGMFDMAEATDILTDANSALGRETEEMVDLGDQLVKANTLANASVEQFGTALTEKAAGKMAQLNVESEEGIAILSQFADTGLKGSRAGTILARTLGGLTNASRKNEEAWEELGIKVFDADGEMRNVADIVSDLESGLEGMTTEQRNAALAQLGLNRRARNGINRLLGNSDALREYQSGLENAQGTTDEVANKQLKTLNEQWGLLEDQVNDLFISLGEGLSPALTDFLSIARDGVGDLEEFVEETDNTTLAIGLAAITIAGIGAALIWLVGTPIALGIGAIAALAGAWAMGWDDLETAATEGMDVTGDAISEGAGWIKDNGPGLAEDAMNAVGTAFRLGAIDIYNAITGNDDSILKNVFNDFVDWALDEGVDLIIGFFEFQIEMIRSMLSGLFEGLTGTSSGQEFGEDVADTWMNHARTDSSLRVGMTEVPGAKSGGFIKSDGLVVAHAGEQVVPAADVDRGGGAIAGGASKIIQTLKQLESTIRENTGGPIVLDGYKVGEVTDQLISDRARWEVHE